jgi:uncharacterized protein YhaN
VKIRRLELETFGHFRGASLAIPESSGLIIVHGENEAGKTTLLEAVRWLLFGGNPARYAIDVDVSKVAVSAAIELSNGSLLEIRRSRGKGPARGSHGATSSRALLQGSGLRGQTAQGDEVDEEWIHGRLGRPNRAIFENVFGFSLEALAQGGKALAHEAVDTAVYGGGLGGVVHPERILEDLAEESGKLFSSERGRNQRIPVSAKKIDEFRARLRTVSTKTEDFGRLQEEVTRSEAAVDAAVERLRAHRSALDARRAVLEAIEPRRRNRTAEAELARTVTGADLPEGAAALHARARERRIAAEAALATEIGILRAAEEEIAGAHDDPEVLAHEARIDELARARGAIEAERRQRPSLGAELAEVARETAARLADLRPGWDLARLRKTRLDAATRAEVEEASARLSTLEAEADECQRAIAESEDELRALDAQRAALPPPTEVAAIRAWLEGWVGFTGQRESLAALDAQLRALERRRDQILRRLDPPLDGRDPRAMVLPRAEEIDRFARDLEARSADKAKLALQIAERDDALREVEAKLVELDALGRPPTEEDLASLRRARDRALTALDEALEGGADRAALRASIAAIERAILAADDASDRMRSRADVVQRRAVHEARRGEILAARRGLEEASIDVDGALAGHHARWEAIWGRAGIVPLAPPAMRAWLEAHETLLAIDDEIAEANARRASIASALEAWAERGRRIVGLEGAAADELRAAAARLVEAEDRRTHDDATIDKQRAREARAIAGLRDRMRAVEEERRDLAERLAPLSTLLGLPPGTGVGTLRTVATGLAEVGQALVHREAPLRDRVARLDASIGAFEDRLRELGAVLAIEGDPWRALETAEERLQRAREGARIRARALRDRALAEGRLPRLKAELAAASDEIARLHALAGVESDDAFLRVLGERAARDEATRVSLEAARRLDRLRGERPLEDFLAEVDAADPDLLAVEIARGEREIVALDDDVRRLERVVGEARTKLDQVDGRAEAAEVSAEIESERAELRSDVERYAVLAFAQRILRDAIARFEREHQPALLETASRIFRDLTVGRYVRVRRRLDRSLSLERADGVEIAPEHLSTGTREQLYLAIRLAYIDHYRRSAEPLPVVLDDVLVNFDTRRVRATLGALAAFAEGVQVLLFTCHDHVLEAATSAGIRAVGLAIPAARPVGAQLALSPH